MKDPAKMSATELRLEVLEWRNATSHLAWEKLQGGWWNVWGFGKLVELLAVNK